MRMMFIGAHPDDADLRAGALAAQIIEHGGEVRFVSLTNGNAGHHEMSPDEIAKRRREEAFRAGEVIGAEYIVLNHDDGLMIPTLEIREEIIRLIRQFDPNMLLTLRMLDYHPDHRAVGQLIVDAAYLLTVPLICPDVPAMKQMPAIFQTWDQFRKPIPFQADIAISIDEYFEQKVQMLACHESQFFEWLPYIQGQMEEVPQEASQRRSWLAEQCSLSFGQVADSCRQQLIERYGPENGARILYAEAFELCEYGYQPDEDLLETFFPC